MYTAADHLSEGLQVLEAQGHSKAQGGRVRPVCLLVQRVQSVLEHQASQVPQACLVHLAHLGDTVGREEEEEEEEVEEEG